MEDNPVFPAVTICNFNLIKKDSVTDPMTQLLLKAMYLDEQWEGTRVRNQLKNMNKYFVENVSVRSLFLKGSPTLETSIKTCKWIEVRCYEKTNILVSDLVRHIPGCTATEDG